MTREPQYQDLLTTPPVTLPVMAAHTWLHDPKRLTFMLARYKFAAKMISGATSALEIGCGDGFGSRIVRQHVESLHAIDFDDEFIKRAICPEPFYITFARHDILDGPYGGGFEAAYALDVIEHVPKSQAQTFMANVAASILMNGVLILGTPALGAQQFASEKSRAGHVNCMTSPELKALCETRFGNVFMFSMNDEMVHTGFSEMAHYLFAVCANKKA